MKHIKQISKSPDETIKIAECLAKKLKKGNFISLNGELGAGKTIFTKGVAKGLGVKFYNYVNSPTFVIVKEYKGRLPLYHFDVYRIDSPDELINVGFERYFYDKGVTVCEWADKIKSILPNERIEVSIKNLGKQKRLISIK